MKVETEELLSIGRFARLTGLTVKALRHYDELDLLVPARVDEWTGYRYYAVGQARDAIAIRRLRELELPLDEVAAVLADPGAVQDRLAVHRARLQGRAVEVEQILGALDRLIEGKEALVPETTIEVQLEDVPELRVAVIGGRVPVDDMFTFVPETIERLLAWLGARGLQCLGPPLTLHRDPVEGIENDALDVEIGFPVAPGATGDDEVSIRVCPAARAAVLEHRGAYASLPAVFEPLHEWILERGFAPAGPVREVYATNPGDTLDESAYLTRICWPLA